VALSLAVVLSLSLAQASFVDFASANPLRTDITYYETPDTSKPSVALVLQAGGPIYNVRNVAYSFTILKPRTWTHNYLFSAQYFLDGERVEVANQSSIEDPSNYANAPYQTPADPASQPLCLKGFTRKVSDGNHTIFFNVTCVSYYYPQEWRGLYFWWKMPPEELHYDATSSTINFTVDTTPPAVSILSLESKTHNRSEIPLSFVLSEPALAISYCLDNVSNVTIDGNTTLTGLSAGEHSVAVYAWDIAGNVGASQTIDFTVAEEQAPLPPEPFSATNVVAASGASIAAVVALGFLAYWKKRKQEAGQ
jgi:hypothetical protein